MSNRDDNKYNHKDGRQEVNTLFKDVKDKIKTSLFGLSAVKDKRYHTTTKMSEWLSNYKN
jgi:hypothetical protein